MVENSMLELEEGEAPCYYKDDEEKVDLGYDLSYFDGKIEHSLGHFQKGYDWGMICPETFGALYGGYGSFVRAEGQSPSVMSHLKPPHRNYHTSRSPQSLTEGAIQNLKAPSNAPPKVNLGTTDIAHFSQNSRVLPGDISVKLNPCVFSAQVPERCPLKDETSNRPGNPTDQRTLKVRIKMNSDHMAWKKTAIYSGLGLNSPSSSLENSPEQSREMPPPSQVTVDESPTSIIQVMTSFPVPGDALMSPLHDSLLFLMRKRKLDQQKLVPSSNGHPEHSALSVEGSASTHRNGQLSKGAKVKVSGKGESVAELKLKNGFKNNTRILMKKKSEAETLEGKELPPNDNEVKGRLTSSDSVREEMLEPISAQKYVKDEKHTSGCGSAKKILKNSVTNSQNNVPLDMKDDSKCKGYTISASKDYFGISKGKEETDLQRYDTDKKGTSHEDEKTNVSGKRAKLSFEGKIKSKENSSNEKPPIVLTKETLGLEMGIVPKPKASGGHGCSPSSRKTPKLKSQKGKVRDKENDYDSLRGKSLEQMDRMDLPERSTDDVEAKWKACLDKPKEKLSGKKIDNRLLSRDAPHSRQPIMENGFASEIVPAAAPFVIEENWVCCDSCQKWRLLPFGTKPEQLPEKWLCSMLNWLPQMNRCDISEEETTKALNALYQPPPQANGTASALPAIDVRHCDQNYQNLGSHATPSEGKKKHVKEIPNAGSGTGLINSTKNHMHEAVKNGIGQPPLESIPMSVAQQVRLKKKADQYTCGTPKKPRRGDMHHADKIGNSDIDLERVGLGSSTGLLTLARGDITNKDQCYSKDTKDERNHKLQVSAKKLQDQTNVSLHGGSLDVRMRSRGDISMKKRKLRDWQDTPDKVETLQNFLHEGKVYVKEESSESGYQKEKKFKISKIDGKESKPSNGDDKSSRKSTVTQIAVSGTKVQSIDATEMDRGIVKEQKPRKHSKKKAHQHTLNGLDSLRGDLGSGHVSLAATSSSSKVSGSNRIRIISEEVKGSPVESVSSSPLKTCNSDKFISARGDASGKDDAGYGGFSLTNNSKRCWDGKGNGNGDRFGTTQKEKILCSSHPESHKFAYQDGDANGEFSIKHKPSSGVCNNHLNSDNDGSLEQHGQFLGNQHAMGHDNDDDRENKKQPENADFLQKSGTGFFFQSKDNVRRLSSNLDRNRTKVSDPVNSYSKKSEKHESEIEPNHHVYVDEKGNNVRHGLLNQCSMKSENAEDAKHDVCRGDHTGKRSSDSGVGTQLNPNDYDVLDAKFSATQSPSKNCVLQLNLIQNHEGGKMQNKSTSGKSQLFSHFQGEGKEETPSLCSRPVAGSEKAMVFQGLPVNGAVDGHVPKSLNKCGNVANRIAVNCSLVHNMPNQQRATDVSAPSPVESFSGQTATNILKEAKGLRDYADYLKNSGFDFESSEASFQAALKFLQGATVLESCSSENGKYGDMTQLQVYTTTAKLCELCAQEYESRKEVASAALAYKCMEVAYMRIVYLKHSSANRDRHELQATLNMAPQGESPCSSASDVDNLNNHVIAEKATLTKGSGSLVFGNHVVAARNRSNFVRLLDFTQDVNFAMEASRKCQNAFAAACATVEAHKNDCVSSIRRVVDFSFQDLEEIIRLIKLAMEAISRSKFGASRD